MFVQETNSPSFQQLSQEMKQKRALHNKLHKTGRKGYHGKRKEWEEEDAKLTAEGKQNPWDQFPGRSRPYLRARVGKKKKNTSEGSGCRMDLPWPTTSVGIRTDYSVGLWDYPTCAARYLME
jgi:hypothetical protein